MKYPHSFDSNFKYKNKRSKIDLSMVTDTCSQDRKHDQCDKIHQNDTGTSRGVDLCREDQSNHKVYNPNDGCRYHHRFKTPEDTHRNDGWENNQTRDE